MHNHIKNPIHATPLAHSIEEAARRASVGRMFVYSEIKSGALKARKLGRRTVILEGDLRSWLSAAPALNEVV